ncbi:MAG: DUF3500 domain-containing protein [Beijerinckiaceae bacterium]
MTDNDFRRFLPGPDQNKIAGPNARAHANARLESPRAQGLFGAWKELFDAPFKGITTDGRATPGLFTLQPDGAPVAAIKQAVENLLALLSPQHISGMRFPVESSMWRNWQNTELYVEDYGLRLEKLSEAQKKAVLDVIRASLSQHGYDLSRNVMRLNRFLGDLVGGPAVMGEWSYTFCLYGEPSMDAPWGWQLFGHHLCLHCFLVQGQMVLSPCFFGAEPSHADEGPFAGIRLFEDEERAGLALMRAFDKSQQQRAIVAHSMMGGDLPEGRRHFADNLHLGGAFQDNRIVPYEGLRGSDMTREQQRKLLDLVDAYLAPMPEGPFAARRSEIERHLADTHFCWIGGFAEDSPFYYRIQSPVTFIEFDHHAGVFLTNEKPEKFHVHTIVRTPNGNDYGIDLLRLHYENASHHKPHGHAHTHEEDGV